MGTNCTLCAEHRIWGSRKGTFKMKISTKALVKKIKNQKSESSMTIEEISFGLIKISEIFL